MAVQEPLMVQTADGSNTLELEADTGESILVKDVMVANPANNYAELTVEKSTVGYWRVGGVQGNHLPFVTKRTEHSTLFNELLARNLIRGIPVGEGESLTIKGVAQSNARQAVLYEQHDAGDITPDMPNGSRSEEYDSILYGRISGGAGEGENAYDVMQNPAEFPDFPFEADVPATRAVTLKGVVISDVGNTTSTQANKQKTDYIKMVSGRETYFDKEKEGLPLEGSISTGTDERNVAKGNSIIGGYSDVGKRYPLIFPEPYTFSSGEELNVFLATVLDAGSANFSAGDAEIGLITTMTPE